MNRLTPIEMAMAMLAGGSFCVVAGPWLPLSAALCLAVLASWVVQWRYTSTARQQRRAFALLGIPFVLLSLFNILVSRSTVDTSLGIAVLGTVYVFCGAVMELYRRAPQARAEVFHMGILTVMMVAGISYRNQTYPVVVALYSALAVALLRRPQLGMSGPVERGVRSRSPWLGIGVALALALILAGLQVRELPKVARRLGAFYSQGLLADLAPEPQIFGASSDLSNVMKMGRSKAMAARVYGPPAKLRGQVFVTYAQGRWSAPQGKELKHELKAQGDEIRLPGEPPEKLSRWTIAPVKAINGPVSLPPGAFRVQGIDELLLDAFEGLSGGALDPFVVEAASDGWCSERSPTRPLPGSPAWEESYLALPPGLAEPLRAWAERAGIRRGDARALETHLAERGTYNPLARRPPGQDPILAFLEGGLQGHCELFASTMALTLRAYGVPTRYVVGYQMGEKNPWGGYYIIRDRDAHAWVEVYVSGRWQVFDPTPAAQYQATHPDGDDVGGLDGIWDGLKAMTSIFVSWLRGASLPGWLLLLALLGVLAWLVRRYPLALEGLWRRSAPMEAEARWLGRVQGQLQRVGLRRRADETVLEFSARLARELAPDSAEAYCGWLERYAAARFGHTDPQTREELAASSGALPRPRLRSGARP